MPLANEARIAELAGFFERLDPGCGRQKIHVHIAAATERRLEFLEHQKYFAIIAARLMFRLDVDRADLSAILPAGQIGTGRQVRVIESQSRRSRREGDAAHAMGRE